MAPPTHKLLDQFRMTAALIQARAEASEACDRAEFAALEAGVQKLVERCQDRLALVTVSRRKTR